MSTIASLLPSLSAGGTLDMRLFAEMRRRTSATIRTWRNNMRQRRELLMLNDVELRELRSPKRMSIARCASHSGRASI